MKQIVIATNNKGKIKEIKEILKEELSKKEIELISLKDANVEVDVEEDKNTFEGNSLKKAEEYSKITNKICIADDSGICIESLNGFPGVETKRFLGETATDDQRNEYLINKLINNIDKKDRKAKVITAISIAIPNLESKTFIGNTDGYISKNKRGNNGFGFDNIFEIEDGRTLAELTSEEKNKISSRKMALEQLNRYLAKTDI